jgi:predicted HicB family RNase H-like nuclease
MKRIIDGKTYNTDTATLVARYEYLGDQSEDTEARIYVNAGGAFFIVHEWETDEKRKTFFEAATREGVEKLFLTNNNVEVIDNEALAEPPEAEAEAETAATIYLRLPASLKKRVEDAAKESSLSVNSWAMRAFEQTLPKPPSADVALTAAGSASSNVTGEPFRRRF